MKYYIVIHSNKILKQFQSSSPIEHLVLNLRHVITDLGISSSDIYICEIDDASYLNLLSQISHSIESDIVYIKSSELVELEVSEPVNWLLESNIEDFWSEVECDKIRKNRLHYKKMKATPLHDPNIVFPHDIPNKTKIQTIVQNKINTINVNNKVSFDIVESV